MKIGNILLSIIMTSFNIFGGTVYITRTNFGMTNEQFFNPDARDGATLPFIDLRNTLIKIGHNCVLLTSDIKLFDENAWFIACDIPQDPEIGRIINEHPGKCILTMWEPPTVYLNNYETNLHKPFKAIFTLLHEMVDNIRYYPLYYPQPYLYAFDNKVQFEEKKLCTLIAGNKSSHHPDELYSQRLQAIAFFEHHAAHEFDFYGTSWNVFNHPCYKGAIANKLPYLQNYKFAICYENMISKTYITEKIFDCLHAGCVPIYWGAQDIAKYIPQQAYILREDFDSDEDLYNFLKSMTKDEYQKYLDAGKNFFASKAAQKFSIDFFINTILEKLFE